jgi:hypothetical protein
MLLQTRAIASMVVSARTGVITTIVGIAQLPKPAFSVLAPCDGNVYFTDYDGCTLYKYDGVSGSVAGFVLGNTNSRISGMAVSPANGKLHVLDDNVNGGNKAVYTVNTSPLGSPSQVKKSLSGDLRTIPFNSTGDAFLGVLGPSIYKLSTSNAYTAWNSGTKHATPGVTATQIVFGNSYGVALDGAGNMLVSEKDLCHVWLVEAATGKLRLVAGAEAGGVCGAALKVNDGTLTQLDTPVAVAFGPGGSSAYITDSGNHRILKVELNCTGLYESPSPSPSPEIPSPSPATSELFVQITL